MFRFGKTCWHSATKNEKVYRDHPTFLNIVLCVRVRTYTALTMSSVKNSVSVKQLGCRKLKEQLDALERETTTKLSEMDQYNRDIKVRWPF